MLYFKCDVIRVKMKSKSMNQNVTLELVLELAKQLSPIDQVRLVQEIIPNQQTLEYYIPINPTPDQEQRLALKKAGEAVDQMLKEHGVTEDELVQEFRDLREGHRFEQVRLVEEMTPSIKKIMNI